MVDVWFTSDFHFGHANIIRYCDRPFSSVAEMDKAILDRLNSCVKTTDHLYFLGDFCIGGPVAAASYRGRIRCKKIHFILGNHDKAIKMIADQFVWVKEIAEVNVQNQPIVLCHYAMRVGAARFLQAATGNSSSAKSGAYPQPEITTLQSSRLQVPAFATKWF